MIDETIVFRGWKLAGRKMQIPFHFFFFLSLFTPLASKFISHLLRLHEKKKKKNHPPNLVPLFFFYTEEGGEKYAHTTFTCTRSQLFHGRNLSAKHSVKCYFESWIFAQMPTDTGTLNHGRPRKNLSRFAFMRFYLVSAFRCLKRDAKPDASSIFKPYDLAWFNITVQNSYNWVSH